jgi:PAS domain-containing protein
MDFRDENNSEVSNINQAVNINNEKSSRIYLKKERQQFESFMENAPLLAWITDEDGILYYMNTLFKNAFRLDDDCIGKNIYDYCRDSMKANFYASDQQVLSTNTSVETFEEGEDESGEKVFFPGI